MIAVSCVESTAKNVVCGSPTFSSDLALQKGAVHGAWRRDPLKVHRVGDTERLWIYNYETRLTESVDFT